MKILVIEDNITLASALEKLLVKSGHLVDISHNGTDGYDNAITGLYDVIILDWMLPDQDGTQVLNNLRQEKCLSPVLMLTAKEQVEDKIIALDYGADDYLTKPFDSEELLARVRALGRRREGYTESEMSFMDVVFNTSSLILKSGVDAVKLSPKESNLLEMLIMAKGNAVTKEHMLEKIWGFNSNAEDNYVEVYISFLRRKLKSLNTEVHIKTVRGVGYCIVGDHHVG